MECSVGGLYYPIRFKKATWEGVSSHSAPVRTAARTDTNALSPPATELCAAAEARLNFDNLLKL